MECRIDVSIHAWTRCYFFGISSSLLHRSRHPNEDGVRERGWKREKTAGRTRGPSAWTLSDDLHRPIVQEGRRSSHDPGEIPSSLLGSLRSLTADRSIGDGFQTDPPRSFGATFRQIRKEGVHLSLVGCKDAGIPSEWKGTTVIHFGILHLSPKDHKGETRGHRKRKDTPSVFFFSLSLSIVGTKPS